MNNFNRLIQGSVIAGFLLSASGCLVVPEHEHEREHERDRDRDTHDREHHCDEHDDRCRDR